MVKFKRKYSISWEFKEGYDEPEWLCPENLKILLESEGRKNYIDFEVEEYLTFFDKVKKSWNNFKGESTRRARTLIYITVPAKVDDYRHKKVYRKKAKVINKVIKKHERKERKEQTGKDIRE